MCNCIVIGGGAAGLSAALVLGRARRDTVLIDAGAQSNLPAAGVGGLLGWEGSPAELYARARAQLAGLPSVELLDDEVVAAEAAGDGFAVATRSGRRIGARALVLAPGMTYVPPDIPGLRRLWGDTVFHCPFCHGWELRGRPLGVLDAGGHGGERALLLRMWSDDVILLTDGPAGLDPAARERLAARGVTIEERPVAGLVDRPGDGAGGRRLDGVRFADGAVLPRAGLLVTAPLRRRSDLAVRLGADLTDAGTVAVDRMGATSVPGLFAAGDVAAPVQQVSVAIAAGALAAAAAVRHLARQI